MPMVNSTLTGTMMPTVPALSAGTKMNAISISTTGATAIFQFLETKATPRPPKRAGSIWANAGSSTGDSKMGVSGTIKITPNTIIMVVTMLEVAMAMVEISSPSSLLALTSFCSKALIAQGSFRLEMLPVTSLSTSRLHPAWERR